MQKVCETSNSMEKVGNSGTHLSSLLQQETKARRLSVQAGLGKKRDCISKITRIKMVRGMAQAEEYLPCEWEAECKSQYHQKQKKPNMEAQFPPVEWNRWVGPKIISSKLLTVR